MRIDVIIPTHNRALHLKNCLKSLSAQTYSPDQIIVVVDGSTDGTIEMLQSEFPEVHAVNGDGSWWYTKSMNEGFRYAINHFDPDFLLTMNDDTEVPSNYIESLLHAYKKVEHDSILGSVSFTKSLPTKIITSGTTYRNRLWGLRKHYIQPFAEINPKEIKNKTLPTIVLPGRGMLIPAKTINTLGLFDEKLMQYHSDEDFCLRALSNGYKVYISWDAHVYVHEKMTGSGTSFLKESVFKFLSNFFSPTSRLYLPSKARMLWRYNKKSIWPIYMMIFFAVSFKNHFFDIKLK